MTTVTTLKQLKHLVHVSLPGPLQWEDSAVAVGNHAMLFVRGLAAPAIPKEFKGTFVPALKRELGRKPDTSRECRATLAQLQVWAGPVVKWSLVHGLSSLSFRPGQLAGVVVDKHLLAGYLAPLLYDGAVVVAPAGHHRLVVEGTEGDGWRLLIAGLHGEQSVEDTFNGEPVTARCPGCCDCTEDDDEGDGCLCEWPTTCGGLGGLQCGGCGGDNCVCTCGGEMECPGCDDCRPADDDECQDDDGREATR